MSESGGISANTLSEEVVGSIEAGKLADIVIVDGNPLDDIHDAMKVRTVIKNGSVYELEDLLRRP